MDSKIRILSIVAILCIWLITGCNAKDTAQSVVIETVEPAVTETAPPTEPEPTEAPTEAPIEEPTTAPTIAPIHGRWDTPALTPGRITFTLEGMEEEEAAFNWNFGTYSIDIPAEYWNFEQLEDAEQWVSEFNPDVRITIRHYDGIPGAEAMQTYLSGTAYVVEDMMGGTSAEDVLVGWKWPLYCSFFAPEDGTVITWEYPAEASEGFGARMHRMAATYRTAE